MIGREEIKAALRDPRCDPHNLHELDLDLDTVGGVVMETVQGSRGDDPLSIQAALMTGMAFGFAAGVIAARAEASKQS